MPNRIVSHSREVSLLANIHGAPSLYLPVHQSLFSWRTFQSERITWPNANLRSKM